MGDLTKNLSRYEFACKCGCGLMFADFETVNVLQDACYYFCCIYGNGIVIEITSGCRCREHNETVQKENNPHYVPYSSRSTHMIAGGVDFKLTSLRSHAQIFIKEVYDYLDKKYPDKYGIILYDTWIHFDPRAKKFRQKNTLE